MTPGTHDKVPDCTLLVTVSDSTTIGGSTTFDLTYFTDPHRIDLDYLLDSMVIEFVLPVNKERV